MPKRKLVGQREEAKGVSESPKPLALAELAAARGITETELMADYFSSLKLHGEIVEESIGKEFPPWLRKFTEVVASNESRTKAWQELNAKQSKRQRRKRSCRSYLNSDLGSNPVTNAQTQT